MSLNKSLCLIPSKHWTEVLLIPFINMCLCAMRTSIILVKTSLHNPSIRVNMANLTLVFYRNSDVEFCSVQLTQRKILDQCDILFKKKPKQQVVNSSPLRQKWDISFLRQGMKFLCWQVPLLDNLSPFL